MCCTVDVIAFTHNKRGNNVKMANVFLRVVKIANVIKDLQKCQKYQTYLQIKKRSDNFTMVILKILKMKL
jgi:hypothetical protein